MKFIFLIGHSESFTSILNPENFLFSNFTLFTYVLHACIKFSKKSKIFMPAQVKYLGKQKKL